MVERDPVTREEPAQCSDLISEACGQFVLRHRSSENKTARCIWFSYWVQEHFSPSEALPIWQGRVGADTHTILLRQLHRLVHDREITNRNDQCTHDGRTLV